MRIYLNARTLPAFGRMPLDSIGAQDMAARALIEALLGARDPEAYLPRYAEGGGVSGF